MNLTRRNPAHRKLSSLLIILNMMLMAAFSLGIINSPNVRAGSVDHTVGDLDLMGLTDFGMLGSDPVLWNGIKQTAAWSGSTPYAGLVFDHSLYDHGGGDYGIADWWDSYNAPIFPDFNVTKSDRSISFEEDSPVMQKSACSYTQVDAYNEIGIAYDVRIQQIAWTLQGKDWAILEWNVENLRTSDLTAVNIGLEVFSSWGAGQNWFGVDGDPADDLDFWDATYNSYYLRDNTMFTIGYASADVSNNLDHYYGDTVNFFDVDKDAYNALTGGSQLAKDSGFTLGTDPIYSLVSWNNRVIPVGQQATFALVIACGIDDASMFSAISEARDFWESTRLKITEVQDSPDANEAIEIFNSGASSLDLNGYYLTPDNGMTKWFLDPLGTISSGGYGVYFPNPASDEMGDEGGMVALFDDSNHLLDKIGYGTYGMAPDPLSGESTARYWAGSRYSRVFTRETAPTFGGQNTVSDADLNPKVVLNEVLFYPQSNEAFIELKYIGLGAPVDLSGWKIVADSEFTIGAVILDPNYRYFVINASKAPGLFAGLDFSADNVYLYNSTGGLTDMVGWSSAHASDLSCARVPEGEGTYDGFNDSSSYSAGWRFSQGPSEAIVNIEADSEDAADLGNTMSFYLNVSNAGDTIDVIDLNFTSFVDGLPGWWNIGFFHGGGSWTPLSDSDFDGLIDVGPVAPGTYVTIVVNVTVPASLPIGGTNIITIEVFSSLNPFTHDTAVLRAGAYPHIEAHKSGDPYAIYRDGASAFGFSPDSATITINLTGAGWIPGTQISQDVMFCMDRSSSMQSSDPTRERVAGAQYYTDLLDFPARAGVVEFNETARMLMGLSDDYDMVKATLASIGADGLTDMSQGLLLSINELIDNGNYYHNRVIILLSDGQNNYPWQDDATIAQAQRAKDNGILIFTIGLGVDADEALLQQVAAITGGKYYFSPTPDNLMEIFGYIAEELIIIAGQDPDPGDPIPMLTDVLPPYIAYIPGTFMDPETGDPRDPSNITMDGNGNTILEWNISQIAIGEVWEVSFDIVSGQIGLQQTNVYGVSSVNYTRYLDANTTVMTNDTLERVWVNVLPIPPLPPALYCNLTSNKNDVWLNWSLPPTPTDHYLIYRSEDKQTFDFSTPWMDTSSDINPITGILDPTNRVWLDVDAGLSSDPSEYYYIVRSVEASGNMSVTSNTVGKWTKEFPQGVSAFSIPLEPFLINSADWYADDIPNVNYIKWADPAAGLWVTHLRSDAPGINDADLVLGEGYEIDVTWQTYYTFCGRPGTSIRYMEDLLPAPTGFGLTEGPMQDVIRSYMYGTGGDGTTDVALGDFDSDNNLDIVAVNLGEWNVVYFGDGDGTFDTRSTTLTGGMDFSTSVAVADVDNDTFLDIVVGNVFDFGDVFLGNGDGTFDPPITFGQSVVFTTDVALFDVNFDTILDIIRTDDGGFNYVYLGDGDGTFDTTAIPWGTGSDSTWTIALGDVNSDTNLDIVSGVNGGQNVVYLGDGDGTFDTTSFSFGTGSDQTSTLSLEDVDNDKKMDIICGNIGEQNVVYFGDGDGSFDTTSYDFGNGLDRTFKTILKDLNGDNELDIVCGNEFNGGAGGQNYVYLGLGDGTFATSYPYGTGSDPTRAVAVGNVNSDGREDIVTGNVYDANYVYVPTYQYTINLSWDAVSDPQLDRYLIYRSDSRDDLNTLSLPYIASMTSTFFSDSVDVFGTDGLYYTVVAVSSSDIIGYNSTYSLGIVFSDYEKGYESFGLPLEPIVGNTVDWYCDDIFASVGMNYYLGLESRWVWHATRMPSGAYDPQVEMANGYQISTDEATKYTFVGI